VSLGYESFFGLEERPFSLTSDPRYFFKSRSHGRAVEALSAGVRERERFLLVTGDFGVGKTVLCRTLLEEIRRRMPAAYIVSPLITPDVFDRTVVEDLGCDSIDELGTRLTEAAIVIDEAHTVPPALLEHVLFFARMQVNADYLFRVVFVGQATPGDPTRVGVDDIDDRATTRVRLLPLGRAECAAYIEHRLQTAAVNHGVKFSPRAHDYVFALSGGVPRLVNLLCERALQEAATVETRRIEPATIAAAATALQLLRARPRRFRWYGRRVS
jgi:type II secretory pathway predicted ATPase ExeA